MDCSVRAVGLSKRYRLRDRPRRYLDVGRESPNREVWAVRDVSVAIPSGQITGVIGTNGSGKSTLLRLIAGVTRPTTGAVEVHGSVRGLLELGDNFNSLLTGAENAVSDLILEGMSYREAVSLLPAIAEFAGLQGRLDQPLRSYSSGMRLRLAFATATITPADVILIDELLAVGDGHFQDKCIKRLEELRESGCTIVLTSHEIDHVTRLCDQAIWMVDGQAKEIGDAGEVADHYNGLLHTTGLETAGSSAWVNGRIARIGAVELRHDRGGQARTVTPGSPLQIQVDYEMLAPVDGAIIEVSVQPEGSASALVEVNTESDDVPIALDAGNHSLNLRLDRLDLAGGRYNIHVGIYSADWANTLAYAWEATSLTVTGDEASSPVSPHAPGRSRDDDLSPCSSRND